MFKLNITLFMLPSLFFAACGPNAAETQAQALASQQRLEEHQKHYIFTPDEIKRCKATPGKSSSQIESYIRNSMKDPDAVKIRNLSKGPLVLGERKQSIGIIGSESSSSTCGWIWTAEVNGKNSYGAYVGYQEFSYIVRVCIKNKKLGFVLLPDEIQRVDSFYLGLLTDDYSELSSWNFRVIR